jgi:hypothetical protein
MRPHIICHMLSSRDGKIDGAALSAVTVPGDYETTGTKLEGDAWICGRTTMQQHFAEDERFVSASNRPAGPQPVHVARRAKSYAISVDTTGKLRWAGGDLDGDHLICVMSELAPEDWPRNPCTPSRQRYPPCEAFSLWRHRAALRATCRLLQGKCASYALSRFSERGAP